MEYKLSKENYTVAKTLYDGTVQQSAELDYILARRYSRCSALKSFPE